MSKKLVPGARVTHVGRPLWGVGTVLRVAELRGLDGRHWVRVEFSSNWKVHAELEDLVEVADE